MATDFRNELHFPRRGRDKARASACGQLGEYFYPCPIDLGMMERWGITREQFEGAIANCEDDDAILGWADRQDREEGAFAGIPA